MLVGNPLKGYHQGDGGNFLSFVPADLSEATNLTFSYYHFSNMGRGILCDDGTATDETPAPATVKEGGDVAEADLGCKWTLYLKLLLVSDRGNYLTLDGEQVKVTPLGSNTEPLRLVSDANTYNGSATRTEFYIYNDRTYALGYDLTSVTKQKTDSRFSVLKAYTTYTELTEGIAKHPETAAVPLISTSAESHYYRITLDGNHLVALTPEKANHRATFSREHEAFIDTYSYITQAPVSVIRSAKDGKLIATLEKADMRRLEGSGWTPA